MQQERARMEDDVGVPLNLEAVEHSLNLIEETETQETTKPKGKPTTARRRERIKVQEWDHFQNVINYRPFQEDPIGAIRKHIINKLAQQEKIAPLTKEKRVKPKEKALSFEEQIMAKYSAKSKAKVKINLEEALLAKYNLDPKLSKTSQTN
eukprot:Platyproteum_vivax@DN2312_c0_g1_i1.p1